MRFWQTVKNLKCDEGFKRPFSGFILLNNFYRTLRNTEEHEADFNWWRGSMVLLGT